MRQGLCNDTVSVCLSVCPILHRSRGFAAVGPAGRQYRPIAARRVRSRRARLSIHIHSSTAVRSKREQCRVYSDVGGCVRKLKLTNLGYMLFKSVGHKPAGHKPAGTRARRSRARRTRARHRGVTSPPEVGQKPAT